MTAVRGSWTCSPANLRSWHSGAGRDSFFPAGPLPPEENRLSLNFSHGPVVRLSRNNWQYQRRRMRLIVINHVRRFDHSRRARLLFAGVQVAVEPRKIAAGNFQPHLVPGKKHIARRPQIHSDVVSLSPIRQLWFLLL